MTERTTTNSLMDSHRPEMPTVLYKTNDIQTFTGRGYDFQAPTTEMIDLSDIAHHLSQICRFAGATSQHCSVAEHSVLVSRILERLGYDRRAQVHGLFHDGHEAYIWDCPRPLKPLLGRQFLELADACDAVICEKFGLSLEIIHEPFVKVTDDMALIAEAHAFMHNGPEYWEDWEERYQFVEPLPLGLEPHGFDAVRAEYLFLDRAKELGI